MAHLTYRITIPLLCIILIHIEWNFDFNLFGRTVPGLWRDGGGDEDEEWGHKLATNHREVLMED